MIYNKKNSLLLLVITMFFSCQKAQKTPSTILEEKLFNLEQIGWKSKTISHFINNMSYKATMVPLQYYILKNEGDIDLKKVDSIYQSMSKERVLEIAFEHEEKDDLLKERYTNKSYEASVKYMAFGLKDDFRAITASGDTINCSGVTFERNFKLAPFKRILLFFSDIPEEEHIKLLYNDQLFGNGPMTFNFTETPIKL